MKAGVAAQGKGRQGGGQGSSLFCWEAMAAKALRKAFCRTAGYPVLQRVRSGQAVERWERWERWSIQPEAWRSQRVTHYCMENKHSECRSGEADVEREVREGRHIGPHPRSLAWGVFAAHSKR